MKWKMQFPAVTAAVLSTLLLVACDGAYAPLPVAADADEHGSTAATTVTAQRNLALLESLPMADRQDFEDARRGLIATAEGLRIEGPGDAPAWNMGDYAFIEGDAPDSVNPSLWRQAQLNNIHGLFKVTDGVYQLRGFDLANMSLIEGDSGWIVVDPLTNAQTAAAAINFAFEHLPRKPITAVLFTHSHIDHFGGVLGALEAAGTSANDVEVIAPEGFLEEATSENILAGPTMMRRAQYMYGMSLPRTARGHVDTGLGKQPSNGDYGVLPPTRLIERTGQRLIIDGVEFLFQIVSGSEAPAEFTFYLPAQRAFCGAEMLSRNLHNLYTLRGAKVRDALAWSDFIDEAAELFGEADIYFASHHWPIWGRERVAGFLEVQRDTYKFLHDQTLRFAYQGLTPREIAERVELPAALQRDFSNRGYYGTVYHNVRAVYQRYFGWYDGNPATLNPLVPEEEAQRYVTAMGGAASVLAQAQESFDAGDYRWAGTLLNHLVFSDASNNEARALLARSYDQLGYQAESGPWRDVYLSGAYELRHGTSEGLIDLSRSRGMIRYAERSHFFDVMAAQIDAEAADGEELVINFHFTDLEENHVLRLRNSVLHHSKAPVDESANATLNITHDLFLDLVLEQVSLKDLITTDQLSIDGSRLDLVKFFALQDKADRDFDIVFP
jgi:alkyl sulfatase BDS1-like metallo-beta-lactamase superfamily hydrolase